MATGDVVVDGLWKTFRIYHQRSSTLKQALLRRGKEIYEDNWVLRDVSFEVPAGTTLGLIGANGAGKSTMLKVLSRILVPDKGLVTVDGRVSALLELGSGFHPELSGRENIFLNGTILGMSQADIARRFDEIVEFAGLEHAIDKAVKTYSSGMQARLGFSVAVAIEPDILIVDEVLAVGDEQFQRRSLERMAELRSGGRTCIFVSHGLAQVQQICQKAVWLDQGTVALQGDTEDVINAYLRSVHGDARIDERGREHRGSGEVHLDVDLYVDDRRSDVVGTGDYVTIAFEWKCAATIEAVQLNFAVHSSDGQVVAGAMNGPPHLNSLWPASGVCRYAIPGFPLMPGRYHVSAELVDRHSGHVYDGSPNLVSFDVVPTAVPTPGDTGYVFLGGHWGGEVHE